MPNRVAIRLRQNAEFQPEPIKSVMIKAADELQNVATDFGNRVFVILLEAENAILEYYRSQGVPKS